MSKTTSRLLILLSLAIAAALLTRTLHALAPARAQAAASSTPVLPATPTPVPAEFDPNDTPPMEPPTLPEGLETADMSGIIAQAVLVVIIILFGSFWGWRISAPRPPRKSRK